MGRLTLTIDGRTMTVAPETSILKAASALRIRIPTLCNLHGLHPLGGCRICLVEIRGHQRPAPACATMAEEGMVVTTDSPRLAEMRRQLIELLLAERNHHCPICIMNENCELQTLARQFGIEHVRYRFLSPAAGLDISQERFGIDHNRCILCRRCLRVCDEIEGAHTWDVSGRGTCSRVISDLNRPWGESGTCTGCGKCVQACPTGALFEKGVTGTSKGNIDFARLVRWRGRRRP